MSSPANIGCIADDVREGDPGVEAFAVLRPGSPSPRCARPGMTKREGFPALTRNNDPLAIEWRDAFGNDEVNALHAEAFGHAVLADDWWGQVNRHSLGWVCLRRAGQLIGFVYV